LSFFFQNQLFDLFSNGENAGKSKIINKIISRYACKPAENANFVTKKYQF